MNLENNENILLIHNYRFGKQRFILPDIAFEIFHEIVPQLEDIQVSEEEYTILSRFDLIGLLNLQPSDLQDFQSIGARVDNFNQQLTQVDKDKVSKRIQNIITGTEFTFINLSLIEKLVVEACVLLDKHADSVIQMFQSSALLAKKIFATIQNITLYVWTIYKIYALTFSHEPLARADELKILTDYAILNFKNLEDQIESVLIEKQKIFESYNQIYNLLKTFYQEDEVLYNEAVGILRNVNVPQMIFIDAVILVFHPEFKSEVSESILATNKYIATLMHEMSQSAQKIQDKSNIDLFCDTLVSTLERLGNDTRFINLTKENADEAEVFLNGLVMFLMSLKLLFLDLSYISDPKFISTFMLVKDFHEFLSETLRFQNIDEQYKILENLESFAPKIFEREFNLRLKTRKKLLEKFGGNSDAYYRFVLNSLLQSYSQIIFFDKESFFNFLTKSIKNPWLDILLSVVTSLADKLSEIDRFFLTEFVATFENGEISERDVAQIIEQINVLSRDHGFVDTKASYILEVIS